MQAESDPDTADKQFPQFYTSCSTLNTHHTLDDHYLQDVHGRAQRGDRTAEDGGRQNEVLLSTLKRTRLDQRVHVWI